MKKLIATTAAVSILAGCSFPKMVVRDDNAPQLPVPYAKVIIEDLSIYTPWKSSEFVWVNGWARIDDGFDPTINTAFARRVKRSIIAGGQSGDLTISILKAGLSMEKSYADDTIFGVFTSGRERGFRCDADVSIRTGSDARRMAVEHVVKRTWFDGQDDMIKFVESCHDELLKQLAAASKK